MIIETVTSYCRSDRKRLDEHMTKNEADLFPKGDSESDLARKMAHRFSPIILRQ